MKRKRGFIICFVGLDGSGKTTLSNRVIKILKNKYDLKCEYIWAKFGINTISNVKRRVKTCNLEYKTDNPYKHPFKNNIILHIYLLYILIEHWVRIIIKIRLPLLYGKNFMCDRYYYDSIVDVVVNFDITYIKAKEIFRFFIGIPEPLIVFYIEIPEEVAYARKKDIYKLSYLKDRKKVYSFLKEDFKMISLDGTQSLEKMEEQISYTLSSYLESDIRCQG
ncbi:MAG: dTMP kinase [Candidatus Hodarchaeota archaeon]